jgi:hypothetical protein
MFVVIAANNGTHDIGSGRHNHLADIDHEHHSAILYDAGRPFTDVERGAVEAALAPNPVIWADRELVYPADQPVPMQSPNVVLTLGEPVVDGDHAVIESGLGCGGLCGRGGASAFTSAA